MHSACTVHTLLGNYTALIAHPPISNMGTKKTPGKMGVSSAFHGLN